MTVQQDIVVYRNAGLSYKAMNIHIVKITAIQGRQLRTLSLFQEQQSVSYSDTLRPERCQGAVRC